MRKAEVDAHVGAIQAAVRNSLPEDEPDCTRKWVYEVAVRVTSDRLPRLVLTATELDHLLTALRDESRSGHYYGNREQFVRRRERIWQKLTRAYTDLTGQEGYPLKPSMSGGTPKKEQA